MWKQTKALLSLSQCPWEKLSDRPHVESSLQKWCWVSVQSLMGNQLKHRCGREIYRKVLHTEKRTFFSHYSVNRREKFMEKIASNRQEQEPLVWTVLFHNLTAVSIHTTCGGFKRVSQHKTITPQGLGCLYRPGQPLPWLGLVWDLKADEMAWGAWVH